DKAFFASQAPTQPRTEKHKLYSPSVTSESPQGHANPATNGNNGNHYQNGHYGNGQAGGRNGHGAGTKPTSPTAAVKKPRRKSDEAAPVLRDRAAVTSPPPRPKKEGDASKGEPAAKDAEKVKRAEKTGKDV